MDELTVCEICGTICERRFITPDGEPVCAICYDEEMRQVHGDDIDDTCPECNGRGRTMEGWPCESCDGTGRCDL